MKNIVIAAFALLLAYYGPQQDQPNRFDAAWMLGALALMAAVGGQLAQAARLPALVGWVGAGLLLGVSGLQIVRPDVFSPYNILLLTTGLCIGFQVGLNVVWPAQLDWRGPVLLAVATVLILLLVTVSVALLVELPWPLHRRAGIRSTGRLVVVDIGRVLCVGIVERGVGLFRIGGGG
jgi:hypothetical protein